MGILQEKLEFVYDKYSVTNIRHCCNRSVSWDCLLIGAHAWALPGRRLGTHYMQRLPHSDSLFLFLREVTSSFDHKRLEVEPNLSRYTSFSYIFFFVQKGTKQYQEPYMALGSTINY